jgi:hypothetical protein
MPASKQQKLNDKQRADARRKAQERHERRTELTEDLLDAFLKKLTEKINSDKCRSQDLLIAAAFFKKNGFAVKPSTEGTPDPLDMLMRPEKEEQARLRNIERAKAANERRAEQFYAKLENPSALAPPPLNQGDPGLIDADDDSQYGLQPRTEP